MFWKSNRQRRFEAADSAYIIRQNRALREVSITITHCLLFGLNNDI
jgi:hypothetical protein